MKEIPQIALRAEDDLREIPSAETDLFEYKSSKVPLDKLKNKISVAASAFWNAGGGFFIAGVNDNGEIDGGIDKYKGKQDIRDWVDNAIKLTEPTGEYSINIIENNLDDSKIEDNKVVIVICFFESNMIPHMAYDKKYYIRVGAHSGAANHYLVESLRSLRGNAKPNLRGIMEYHPTKPRIEQLAVIALNEGVALDVKLNFDPLPLAFKQYFSNEFPLEIAAIDKNNPFTMEISGFGFREQAFGKDPVMLKLEYKDVLGNIYKSEQEISPQKNLQPMTIGDDIFKELVNAIENLTRKIK
ncbi:helix-turn-helix domain-containing protein [Lentibacillus sediminis]|uniref:AlbA family DNA-binding domain-containing protein n=1 Tax=Lentibacillus sediminis TaxID=1940529 RepID=UPI000C1BD73C|nr:ATP-binding protein [Lentibacillus sediminis]